MNYTCINCGKEYRSNKKNSKFCCMECRKEYRIAQKVPYKCAYCGKEILLIRSEFERLSRGDIKNKFCSRTCADEFQKTSKQARCDNCGKAFIQYPSMMLEHSFCSRMCYEEYRQRNRKTTINTCPICGTTFQQRRPEQIYCSAQCRAVSDSDKVLCECEICGKSFKRKRSEVNKNKHHFCSKTCKMKQWQWDTRDIEILKTFYGKEPVFNISKRLDFRYDTDAIKRKAAKIGCSTNPFWSSQEEQLLRNKYSIVPTKELLKLLPNRTLSSIIGKARSMGLMSYHYLTTRYTDEERDYLRNNYTEKSNKELADYLGRGEHAIEQQLRTMGLFRENEISKTYIDIGRYIRARLYTWRDEYRKKCNYTCSVTGQRTNVVVHHCQGFNLLLEEAMEIIDFQIKEDFSDYTDEELLLLFDTYYNLQEARGEYVCVREDIHKQFHTLYGFGDNTMEQWKEFVDKYKTEMTVT